MKNFKGTPGPWFWDEEGLGNKNLIVLGKEYPVEMTSKENKHLIAAAPELLEALQDAVAAFDKRGDNPCWDFARAAINKAIGGE